MAQNENVILPFTYKHVANAIISYGDLHGIVRVYFDMKLPRFRVIAFWPEEQSKAIAFANRDKNRWLFLFEWDTLEEIDIDDNDLIMDSPETDYDYIAWKNDPIAQQNDLSFKEYLFITGNTLMHLKAYLVKKMEKQNLAEKWLSEYKSRLNSAK